VAVSVRSQGAVARVAGVPTGGIFAVDRLAAALALPAHGLLGRPRMILLFRQAELTGSKVVHGLLLDQAFGHFVNDLQELLASSLHQVF